MKVLFISRESEPVRRLVGELQQNGFVVNLYPADEDAHVVVRHDDSLAIVLGPDLRGLDPRELVRRLRVDGEHRPVLIIAPEALYAHRVALLNIGADDVFSFPCTVGEVMARIRAVVRRSRGFAKPEIRINGIVLDLNARCAYVQDNKVPLTSKEYQILELLSVNKGKVLSKDTIMNHLYDYDTVPDPKIIDVFICKIRKKIQAAGGTDLIQTVWGQGYLVRDEAAAARDVSSRSVDRKTVSGLACV